MSDTAASSSRIAAPSLTRSVEALPIPARTPLARVVPGNTTRRFVAEAFELRLQRRLRPFADGEHGDQGRDADEDAEHGQRGAQLVSADAARRGDERHPNERSGLPPARRILRLVPAGNGRRGGRDCRGGPAFVGGDDAVAHRDDSVGGLGQRRFVRDEHDRQAALAVEISDRREDFLRRPRIEVPGRLVGEQDRRVVDQGAGDRDALLLAAGELVGMAVLPPGEADEGRALRAPSSRSPRAGRSKRAEATTFSAALVRARRLKLWNTKPMRRLRIRASDGSSSPATSIPSSRYVPDVGRSRQPMMFIRVDLPDPDAPMIATNSPRSIVRLTAAQRVDLLIAELVDLGDVADFDCRGRNAGHLRRPHERGPGGRKAWPGPPCPGPGRRRRSGAASRRRPR